MFYTYILRSLKDKRFYIGFIKNLPARVKQHNYGQVKSTKNRRPLVLIHQEFFRTKQEARKRELYLKRMKNSDFIIRLTQSLAT